MDEVNRAIRVCHVGPDPAGLGGISAVISVLTRASLHHRSLVTWRRGSTVRSLWLAVVAALRLAGSPHEEVVHGHVSEGGSWLREGGLVVWAHLLGHRTALTLHGADFGEWVSSSARAKLVVMVLRSTDVIFVLHEGDQRLVRRLTHGRAHIRLVMNPVVPAGGARDAGFPEAGTLWPDAERREKGIDKSVRIAFVGEMSRRKGLDVLLEAWLHVTDATLVIAGPSGDVTPPKLATINCIGPVAPHQVEDILRACDVLVLPSRAEALPMILLECLSLGKPFISTTVAGIPRLLASGACVLVQPGDVGGLVAAMAALINQPSLRSDMATKGRSWYEQNATPWVVLQQLEAGYSSSVL